jgi:drug/metabolite transporter (DMT)-like permease
MRPDQPISPRQRLLGVTGVVIAGLIWGSIPLLIRTADGASVVKVFFRVSCAAAVVAVYLAATGGWREVLGLRRKKLIQLIVQGLILTLNWFLFLTALDLTNVATAELLAYTGPVFVAVFAPLVTKEPFDRRVVAPLAAALLGIAVILIPHGLAMDSQQELIGAALAFLSALTYATLLLRAKNIIRGVSSGALMLVEYSIASVVLAPFVILAYGRGDVPSSAAGYAALVTLGVVHTAVAGFIFLGGMRRVRTDHVAILTYIEPVSAVVLSALVLAEPITAPTAIGGAMVVAGGVWVARMKELPGVEAVPIEVPEGR